MTGPACLSEPAHDRTAFGSNLVLGRLVVAVGGFLALDGKRRGAAAIVATVAVVGLIGISGVYLGLRWPSDVLAGWVLGMAWGWACWTVIPR